MGRSSSSVGGLTSRVSCGGSGGPVGRQPGQPLEGRAVVALVGTSRPQRGRSRSSLPQQHLHLSFLPCGQGCRLGDTYSLPLRVGAPSSLSLSPAWEGPACSPRQAGLPFCVLRAQHTVGPWAALWGRENGCLWLHSMLSHAPIRPGASHRTSDHVHGSPCAPGSGEAVLRWFWGERSFHSLQLSSMHGRINWLSIAKLTVLLFPFPWTQNGQSPTARRLCPCCGRVTSRHAGASRMLRCGLHEATVVAAPAVGSRARGALLTELLASPGFWPAPLPVRLSWGPGYRPLRSDPPSPRLRAPPGPRRQWAETALER